MHALIYILYVCVWFPAPTGHERNCMIFFYLELTSMHATEAQIGQLFIVQHSKGMAKLLCIL